MIPPFRDQLVHQLQCQGPLSERGARELADAAIAEGNGEAFPDELVMLRGLVSTLRVVAVHGDLDQVQKLLGEHERDEQDAYAEQEKSSRATADATPQAGETR